MDKLSVEEIEITPDMLEAGLDAISLYDWSDPGDWIVTSIYSAMEKVRRNKDSGVSPDDSFHPTDAGHEKIGYHVLIEELKDRIKRFENWASHYEWCNVAMGDCDCGLAELVQPKTSFDCQHHWIGQNAEGKMIILQCSKCGDIHPAACAKA